MKYTYVSVFLLIFSLAAAMPPGGSGSLDNVPATDTIIDLSLFQMGMLKGSQIVDCELESESGNNVLTQCYELTFSNYTTGTGPGCPLHYDDVGGFGSYDGPTNPGFQIMNSTLWDAMEDDGYNIVKNTNDSIRIQNPSAGANTRSSQRTMGLSYCLEAELSSTIQTTYLIPIDPDEVRRIADTNHVESVEAIGVALDGQKIAGEPPSVISNSGNIPALDWCGGHPDPSEYYHWHFVSNSMNTLLDDLGIDGSVRCTDITQNDDALFGYAADGYPIYGETDGGNRPNDLDECGGHTGSTNEYPSGIYHYHALPNTVVNLPPCLVGLTPFEGNRFSFEEVLTPANSNLERLDLSVYPNPSTNGVLYIENPYDELEIFNAEGISVYSDKNKKSSDAKEIRLESYATGVYFIQIFEGDKYGFQKVLVRED